MKRAKLVHDNLNAGGGSERLAFATIELLNEMNFVVDLATLQKPNLKETEQNFGNDASHLWKFNQIEILDMYSLLDLEEIRKNKKDKKSSNEDNNEINNKTNKSRYNDKDYDLIINTHGDLFPYYNVNKEHNNKNYFLQMNQKKENKTNIKSRSPTIKITYCHYPLVPQLIKRNDYSFLEIFFESINEFPQKIKDKIATKILEKYNQMMKNTFILTNSKFSKQAIEKIYGNDSVEATIIYPPVDVSKFNIFKNVSNKNINNSSEKDHNAILVISRISPDKKIENAIEIGKRLKGKENIGYYYMTIIGNIDSDNENYLEKLNNLIAKYDLKDNIKIKPDVHFDELQKLLEKSSIYFHPTPNEPFGISIVEAMSAGLIPITPNWGDAEFVPSKYQYQSIEHATEIIAKLIKNKIENNLSKERKNISDLTDKFSKQKYKEHFRNVIESLLENK